MHSESFRWDNFMFMEYSISNLPSTKPIRLFVFLSFSPILLSVGTESCFGKRITPRVIHVAAAEAVGNRRGA